MKRRVIINAVLVVLFLMMISVPLLLSDKTGGEISTLENRYLASAPQLFTGKRINWQGGALRTQVEDWIDDNAFGRAQAKDALAALELDALGTAQYEDTLFAKDGWVFLWNDTTAAQMLHTSLYSQETLQMLRDKAQQLSDALADKGIAFAMTLYPHKAEMCTSHLPETLKPQGDTATIHQLIDTLTGQEGLNCNSPYDALRAAQAQATDPKTDPVYYASYDASHWNHDGAFLGYLAQMEAIQNVCPEVTAFTAADYQIEPVAVERNWYGRYYADADTAYLPLVEQTAVRNDGFFSDMGITTKDIWRVKRYYYNPGREDAPKALIVGDSYTWMFFIDDLAESFSQMLYINSEDADLLWDIIDIYQPDVVSYAGVAAVDFLINSPVPGA